MEVYYYVPVDEKEYSLSCGIKLSVKSDKKVLIDGYSTSCISTLLNPRDDLVKYNSNEFACLKLDINTEYCRVADKALLSSKTIELYNNSIVPPGNYIFGTYRIPECLVACTILPENISALNKAIDSPVLYHNSEELYINRVLEELKDKHEDFNEIALNLFFDKLTHENKVKKIENGNMVIFTSTEDGEIYTIKRRIG